MRKIYTLILIFTAHFANADYWTQKASFAGGMRYVAVGFSIGNKGYVGTGNNITNYYQDFWEYDPVANSWTQKANFPGAARYFACGFSIGSKGYIGLGQDPGGYLQDFWAYNPQTNSWTQIANFGGGARGFQPTVFSIDGYGYAGLGFDGADKQDIWQYDTLLNTWTQKANFGGTGMEQSVSFTIGNKAYVGTGETSIPMYAHKDFWEYDPVTDSWTQLADFPGTPRFSAAGFSIGLSGYIGTGYDSANAQHTDFYQYNVASNSWTQKASVGGVARSHGVGFSIGPKGYIGTGLAAGGNLADFWEYTPDSTTGISDSPRQVDKECVVYPNPASDFIVCNLHFTVKKKIELTITNVEGKKVYSLQPETENRKQENKIDVSNFPNGIYFVTVSDGNQRAVKKFIKN